MAPPVGDPAGWQHFTDQFEVDPERHQKGMTDFLDELRQHGVTALYDGGNLGYEDEVYAFLAGLERKGELHVRYEGTVMIYVPERRHVVVDEIRRLREAYGGERLRFNTVKLFMDGISKNRSGGMLEPYDDDPSYEGSTMMSSEELAELLGELHEEKLDLHVHAIGDLAVRTALDGVEAAREQIGEHFHPRVTLAHLEVIDSADLDRFADLGVVANFTPWWFGVPLDDHRPAALGEVRMRRTFPARSLVERGATVTFSSDNWVLGYMTPFLGMQVGRNRQYPNEWARAAGLAESAMRQPASERLTIEQMIRGYTINGAHPLRMEDDIGSIEVGKSADLVVLEEDLFAMDPYEIHKIEPSAVMLEGSLVHGKLP